MPDTIPAGIDAIGQGASAKLTRIGTIIPAVDSTSARFPIRALAAHKALMLHLNGGIDVTTQLTSVDAYGPAKFLKGIRTLVAGQPGPYTVSGLMLYLKNLADHKRAPYLSTLADNTVADNKLFEFAPFIDFAFPNFEDGDASLLKTKADKTYELEFDFGNAADFGPGGASHISGGTAITLDVYAQEINGLDLSKKNVYNKNYSRIVNLAVNDQLRVPLDLSAGFLNMLYMIVKDTNGALSDAVISSVALRDGSKEIFFETSWKGLKRWLEQRTPIVSPATLPTGMAWLDITENNVFKSMRDARRYKELELVFKVAAVGTLELGLNLATDPVPGD